MTALLEARDLSVVLETEDGLLAALEAVDLSIARGETFALVGESGCGKSMTALALMRLLPETGRIRSGSVRLGQEELLALPEAQMRARRGGRIGIIFQDPSTSLNPVLRVGEQIAETIRTHRHVGARAARAAALDWLRLVGLPEPERRIDSYPFQLSGGQKQRVMIAIALAAEPDLLIADEPTTALDVTIQAQILELLKSLQQRLGMGMLLITHDLGVVRQMAHRVALMYAGEIVEVANAEAFFTQPLHPYAVQLFAALPETVRRDQALATIPGSVPPLTTRFDGCRFTERCARTLAGCGNTIPRLIKVDAGHAVRCLHYRSGAGAAPPVGSVVEPAAEPAAKTPVPNVAERPDIGLPQAAEGNAAGAGSEWPTAPAEPAPPLLSVRDLTVYFPIRKGLLRRTVGFVKAVDGVSFDLAPGRTLALVGESGCGKTTTGKALVQLLRTQAEIGGSMQLAGRDLKVLEGAALRAARRDIQIIFQDPFASLDPRMRVADILEEGLIALRPEWGPSERQERLAELIGQVGLRSDVMQRFPHEFSGGQRQRLAIARALAVGPRVVVCDEPTSALDVSVQAQILNLLRSLQDRLGLAYLFITHNIGVVEYLAHEVAVMKSGHIVERGLTESILVRPADPYTRTLLEAVPRLERRAGT